MRLRWALALLLAGMCVLYPVLGEETTVVKTDVQYSVHFSAMEKLAPGSCAWMLQPGVINEPVMFSEDPEYYLKRTFTGRVSRTGAIFTTGEVPPDFSADTVTLFGKNCMDNSLFGSLSEYRKASYYQEHPTFYLLTPEGDYQLDVFAGVRVPLRKYDLWKVSGTTEELFANELPRILEMSFLTPDPELLPTKDDAWALLSTESYEGDITRFVIYARKRPIRYEDAEVTYVNQMDMDERLSYSGVLSAEGVGSWRYYAQNDPTWNRLVFEAENSSKHRPFGDGGCGPTSVAIAIANLVPPNELCKIGDYALNPEGYLFCSCSMTDFGCNGHHLRYQISTAEEYLRYFPLVVGNFAAGNNTLEVRGRYPNGYGTSMEYLEKICGLYGITIEKARLTEAISAIAAPDVLAISCTVGRDSPLTNSSHFVVLASADSDYLYILDPLCRADYSACDPAGWVRIVQPGLVRIPLSVASECGLSQITLLRRNAQP